MLMRVWNNWKHSTLMGMQNGSATLENSLVYMFTIKPSNPPTGTYPSEMKTYVHTKNTYIQKCLWQHFWKLPKTVLQLGNGSTNYDTSIENTTE